MVKYLAMNEIEFLIKRKVAANSARLKRLCAPLETLGIDNFVYFFTDEEGHYGALGNHVELMDYYHASGLYLENPYIAAPSALPHGMALASLSPDVKYRKTVDRVNQKYALGDHFFLFQKEERGMEGYFFSSTLVKNYFYLENFELLTHFARFFKKEAFDLIERIKVEDFNIIPFKGNAFYHRPNGVSPPSNKSDFLRQLYPLSEQEQRCLEFYKRGKTAKETALLMELSHRTIESYFENIKSKLGCHSKKELLQL